MNVTLFATQMLGSLLSLADKSLWNKQNKNGVYVTNSETKGVYMTI